MFPPLKKGGDQSQIANYRLDLETQLIVRVRDDMPYAVGTGIVC